MCSNATLLLASILGEKISSDGRSLQILLFCIVYVEQPMVINKGTHPKKSFLSGIAQNTSPTPNLQFLMIFYHAKMTLSHPKFPPGTPTKSSTLIHFHPLSTTFIHFHPLASTCIHFHPLSSTFNLFIHFHPLSSTFIHFHPLSSTFIHNHPL